jgi:type III restriction enzyme
MPEERLTARFNEESVLELTPDLVGPSVTRNEGIIGEGVDLNLEHIRDMRKSTVLFYLTTHLLTHHWRNPGEEPRLHLFGQLKRIAKQWMDTCLVCKGGTQPVEMAIARPIGIAAASQGPRYGINLKVVAKIPHRTALGKPMK